MMQGSQLPSFVRGFLRRRRGGLRLILVWFFVMVSFSPFSSSEGKDCSPLCLETGRHQVDIEGFPQGFGTPLGCLGLRDSCADSGSFCFPSAPLGLLADEDGSHKPSSDASQESSKPGGISSKWRSSSPKSFQISGGGVVTCSLSDTVNGADDRLHSSEKNHGECNAPLCQPPLVPDNWMKALSGITSDSDSSSQDVGSSKTDGSSSLKLEISPPVLDWGTSSLYSASLALVTVTNMQDDRVLQLYEPFSTDPQFYAHGYENLSLAPGENASIAFVFLPRLLGSSSAHLVLQTNFGGFIIQAKGTAIDSPYQIEPLVGVDISVNNVLKRNLSIYNPFSDILRVEEVSMWISALEMASQSTHVVCRLDDSYQAAKPGSFSSNEEWYGVSRNSHELPRLELRPHEQWEVPPQKGSSIIELNLWPQSEGKVFGAICMKLQNQTTGGINTIVVPLELQLHGKTTSNQFAGLVSVSFERLLACDERESIFSVSLRNEASQLLKLLSITEHTKGPKAFQIKYIEGLLLFAGSVTEIALIRYTPSMDSDKIPADPSAIDLSCNIVIETNISTGQPVEISCQDLVRSCLSYLAASGVSESDGSYVGLVSHKENEESANTRTGSLENIMEESLTKPKLTRTSEADDLVLRNWLSHGTTPGMSVLKDEKMLFPVVEIGFQYSKWVTVHNPSQSLAVVQLVLHSREIIDQCKSANDLTDHTFSSRSPEIGSTETRFGFSIADSGITEALVYPYESASLGPVVFRPSGRCVWSSSALIRNNVSGVEWLPLRASGGSHSIVLLEGSETVWRLEFNHNMSSFPLMETACPSCTHQLLLKEIHAKNTGELPLKVKKVQVSGTDCGLNGFTVSNCKGFALVPGESARLVISYRLDFSSAVVQRDLELAMPTGIFVVPMKASIPVCMLDRCRTSFLRSVHWKVSALLLAVVSMLLVLIRFVPHSSYMGTEEFFFKLDDGSTPISRSEKSSRFLQHSHEASRSVGESKNTVARNDVLDGAKRVSHRHDSDRPRKGTFSPPPPPPPELVLDTRVIETPPGGNLTIRVVKEKARRKKRKASGSAGLAAAKFEASSSHSGNSTPSSPVSPSSSSTSEAASNPFGSAPTLKHEEKHHAEVTVEGGRRGMPSKTVDRPAVLASAVYPGPSWRAPSMPPSFLALSSPMAPHARAPGSKLGSEKTAKPEKDESVKDRNKFLYDIWGDHICGDILGERKENSPSMAFDGSEGDSSQSFFAREPRSLVTVPSAAQTGGSPGNNELSPNVVTCFYQMN